MSAGERWNPRAIVLLALLAAGAVFVEVSALAIWAMGCDETCDTPVHGRAAWKSDPEAWQWHFQFGLGTVVLVLAVAALNMALGGRNRAALRLAGAGVTVFAGWLMLVW